MTHVLRWVRAEEYEYCVKKIRENVRLETWIWRRIVTSQTAHTNTNDHHMPLNEAPSMKIFCVHHCFQTLYMRNVHCYYSVLNLDSLQLLTCVTKSLQNLIPSTVSIAVSYWFSSFNRPNATAVSVHWVSPFLRNSFITGGGANCSPWQTKM